MTNDETENFAMLSLAEVCGLGLFLIVGHELICSGAADRRFFAFVKERGGAISGAPADQSRCMGFGDGGVLVRAIKRPMYRVGRDTMKVAFLAEVAFDLSQKTKSRRRERN